MTQPSSSILRRVRRSAGVGLVTAIFLLVVLAGLGVALVSVFNTQQQGAALDEQGARAYEAARAGVEWALFQRLVLKDDGSACSAAGTSFALPAGSVLAGFVVTVRCTEVAGPTSDDPTVDLTRWNIEALACTATLPATCANAPKGPDYVERRIEVQL
jgi:MSHA biogenesis protein MshP